MSTQRSLATSCLAFVYRLMDALGFNARTCWRGLRGMPLLLRDARRFARSPSPEGFHFPRSTPFPCPADRFAPSGTASGPYFHQDLWAAQRIFRAQPRRHVDVGSSVAGFVAHVASFREIEVLDIRPLHTQVPNLVFRQMDLMAELPPEAAASCDSLSCLHALEHFGLGRYGDPVRADGFLAGWNNLYRLLEPGGTLYFSVPLGRARIEFNAHRIFSIEQLRRLIGDRYTVRAFAFVDDQGAFFPDRSLDAPEAAHNFGCRFGCAILELEKRG